MDVAALAEVGALLAAHEMLFAVDAVAHEIAFPERHVPVVSRRCRPRNHGRRSVVRGRRTSSSSSGRLRFLCELRDWDEADLDPDFLEANRRFVERTHGDTFLTWFAEDDGQCVGFVSVVISDVPPRPEELRDRDGYIINVHTDPSRRHRGIGRLLIDACMADCAGTRRPPVHTPRDRRRPTSLRVGRVLRRTRLDEPLHVRGVCTRDSGHEAHAHRPRRHGVRPVGRVLHAAVGVDHLGFKVMSNEELEEMRAGLDAGVSAAMTRTAPSVAISSRTSRGCSIPGNCRGRSSSPTR